MKLSSQVCTLEQAKRLKDFGITKYKSGSEKGFYYWLAEPMNQLYFEDALPDVDSAVAAYSVAELGVMLPYDEYRDWLPVKVDDKEWAVWERQLGLYDVAGNQLPDCPTEAQARASMLIHLLETGKVTASECNTRLISA